MRRFLFISLLFLPLFVLADPVNIFPYLPLVTNTFEVSGTPGISNILLDATGEKAAFVFNVVGTKTFRKFGTTWGTITTGATLDVRLETVSQGINIAAPTGTLACSLSSAALVLGSGDSSSYKESANMAADCTVTNSTIAVVIAQTASFNGNLRTWTQMRQDFIVVMSSVNGVNYAATTTQGPILTSVDSSNNYMVIPGMISVSSVTATTLLSTTNPDTLGNYVNLPFGHRVIGVCGTYTVGAPATVKIWNGGGTVLESINLSSATNNANARQGFIMFSQGYVFPANTPYRLTMQATTAITGVTVYKYSWQNSTIMSSVVPFGQYIYFSTGNAPTQESNWTQSTSDRYQIFPVIDQIYVTPGQNTFYDSTLQDTTVK